MFLEAVEKQNLKKVAIFHDSTAYGGTGREQLTAQLAKAQLSPVAIESFKLGTTDLPEALKRAKAAGAEAILTLCYRARVGCHRQWPGKTKLDATDDR